VRLTQGKWNHSIGHYKQEEMDSNKPGKIELCKQACVSLIPENISLQQEHIS